MHSKFVESYFLNSNGKEPKSFAIEEFRSRMEEMGVRFEKSECFDLPDKLYEQRLIEMEPKQAQLYVALKNFLAAQLSETAENGGTVTIMGVLAMMVKLAEAANGWIYDDDHNLINLSMNPKKDAVMDVLADLNEDDKVIIWSRFTNDLHVLYDAIKNEYGTDSVAIIHGGEHCTVCGSRKSERFEITERFNAPGSPLKYVIVNSAVGAHGIDLIGATYEFFFSNSFVKTDRSQAEDRAHRWGMREKLTIIDFIMKDTVDEDVLMALKSWKSMTSALLGHLGIDTKKLFPTEGAGAQSASDAPVIVEHISQRPGECALTAIAMLANKSIELVRSWMTVFLGDAKKYKGQIPHILAAVEHFIPQLLPQWKEYTEKVGEAKTSLQEISIPSSGSGLAVIRHEKSKRIGNCIAFTNGYVYDPSRMAKTTLEKYTTWLVSSRYNVEWVFTMPEGQQITVDESLSEAPEI
jgi:hypothetical protein